MLTNQAIFNRALDGVVRQGGPSMDGRGCVYRGTGGRRCAIGQLIDDQYYDPAFDDGHENNGGGIGDLLALSTYEEGSAVGRRFIDALLASGVNLDDALVYDLCKAIQTAHDVPAFHTRHAAYQRGFIIQMRKVAEDYKLEMPEC
jgi:hypothetical protein